MVQTFIGIDTMCMKSNLRHLFSIDEMNPGDIERITDDAAAFQTSSSSHSIMTGKLAGLCFFQQSTRTRIGFDAAMKKLGGSTLSVTEPRVVPRAPTEETIEDTIRVVSAYCDVIIMRHKNTQAVKNAMQVSVAPIINAGSGNDHHPTQTLVDLFHIKKHFGKLSGLRIGFVGDLQTSRAARSLARVLRHWPPAELRLMSPTGRMIEDAELDNINKASISVYDHLKPDNLDVLYVAGLPNPEDGSAFSAKTREALSVNTKILSALPDHCIVMCPLPRIDEIDLAIDGSPKATYFQQSDDGIWVRMAILQWMQCEG